MPDLKQNEGSKHWFFGKLNPLKPSYDTKELARIELALKESQEKWRVFPAELEKELRAISNSLTLPGFTNQGTTFKRLPDERVLLTTVLKKSSPPPLSPTEASQLFNEKLDPQLNPFGELRKKGLLAISLTKPSITSSGDLKIAILCVGGMRIPTSHNLTSDSNDPSLEAVRRKLWANVAGNITSAMYDGIKSPASSSSAQYDLNLLQTYYSAKGKDFFVSLTQALSIYFSATPSSIRRYGDLGMLNSAAIKHLPDEFKSAVTQVKELTRNVPGSDYLRKIEARTRHIELSPHLQTLLSLEKGSEIYSLRIVDVATLELKEAVRFAKEKAGQTQVDPKKAGEIVRSFFEEHFPGEYNYSDDTPGVSAGIVTRRTDCSTRAVIAHEMFGALNVKNGLYYMMVQKDGEDIPTAPAHVINWVSAENGEEKIFFDFGQTGQKQYKYSEPKAVVEHYLGSSGLKARTTEFNNPAEIFGALVREPILSLLREFMPKYAQENLDLPDYLRAHPETIALVRRIVSYLEKQDELFQSNEAAPFKNGSREEILKEFGAFVPGGT